MGKNKNSQDNSNGAVADISQCNEDQSIIMKKGKKGRKNRDDFEDDIAKDLEELAIDSGLAEPKNKEDLKCDADKAEIQEPNTNTKKGKRNRKNRDNYEEDIERELEELAMDSGISFPKSDVQPKKDTVKEPEKNSITNGQQKPSSDKEQNKKKKDNEKQNKTKENKSGGKKDDEKSGGRKVDSKSGNKKEDPNKKGKKGDKKEDEPQTKAKKGPSKKMLESLKEMQAKQREEEEKRKQEILELERREDERIRQIAELKRLEEERKEKAKQKQKEKKIKLREEGKYMTPKQKQEQKRAKASLELILKEKGLPLPGSSSQEGSNFKRNRRRKLDEQSKESSPQPDEELAEPIVEEKPEEPVEIPAEDSSEDDVKEAWDDLTDSENEDQAESKKENGSSEDSCKKNSNAVELEIKQKEQQKLDTLRAELDHQTKQDRVVKRIEDRRFQNEKNKSPDNLRSPVVCVLGHVDHGKTKILDKLKGTNVQEGEAGNITQEIRATIVSPEIIGAQTRMVEDFDVNSIKFPGLLIIDTPGHESFSNLRNRGSSLCDFAILVIDVNQGVQPTTIESINLLKSKKTPFIVAINKIDILYEWEPNPNKDVRRTLEDQKIHTKNDFDRRVNEVIQQLNIQGLNAALFWENPNPKTYVSLVPTNAIGGDGMGNLISQLCLLCQKRLSTNLQFSEELQCTVLEVSAIQGHGTTVYVVLVNGRLNEGDTIVIAGTDGPIVTQIRSLHIPKSRSRFQYDEYKQVKGTQGIMVAAKDLDKAIAGWSLSVADDDNEIEYIKEQVDKEFKAAMRSMKVKDKGVYVQASSIGALEALLTLFRTSKIPYSGIKVGPVVKKDVMKASAMLEHDPMYAIILAFNVKVEKDAQELADKEGVKIFSEPIIYHLSDRFQEYIKSYKKKKQDEFRNVAVFPCRLTIKPDAIFNKRDPIVMGVNVEEGLLRTGTPLCVQASQGRELVDVGIVSSLEFDHKPVEIAKKGIEVCIKIEPLPGQAPKLIGRHFDETDELVSKISRESLDACKEYFREDLVHSDWKLMAKLKKDFQIL